MKENIGDIEGMMMQLGGKIPIQIDLYERLAATKSGQD